MTTLEGKKDQEQKRKTMKTTASFKPPIRLLSLLFPRYTFMTIANRLRISIAMAAISSFILTQAIATKCVAEERQLLILNHPIEYLVAEHGRSLRSWRKVTLVMGSGANYGLGDVFFAEHVAHGPYAISSHPDKSPVQLREIGYVVKGKLYAIDVKDIVQDRCYSLSMLEIIKDSETAIAEIRSVDQSSSLELSDSLQNFKQLLENEGYVVENMDSEVVKVFLKDRKSEKDGSAKVDDPHLIHRSDKNDVDKNKPRRTKANSAELDHRSGQSP